MARASVKPGRATRLLLARAKARKAGEELVEFQVSLREALADYRLSRALASAGPALAPALGVTEQAGLPVTLEVVEFFDDAEDDVFILPRVAVAPEAEAEIQAVVFDNPRVPEQRKIAHRSTRRLGYWQLSRFWNGEPTGHSDHATLQEVFEAGKGIDHGDLVAQIVKRNVSITRPGASPMRVNPRPRTRLLGRKLKGMVR